MSLQRLKLKARMLVEEAKNGFLLHIAVFSQSTQVAYSQAIERFVAYAPPKVAQITAEDIERFLLILRKDHCASTVNLYLAAIKSWYNWLEATHGVPNIARHVARFKALPPCQRILSKKEYQAVVKATNGHTRDCIQFLANSGLRASEFLSLRPENVDGQFITIVGKGQKQRSIPINKTLRSILKSNPSMQFLKSRNRKWLLRLCYRAAKAAEIPRFSPHALRHYFTTQLYNHGKGVDLLIISRLLGHSSISVTEQVYVHLKDSDLIGATDVLD